MEPNFKLAFFFGKRQTGLTMKTRPQLLFLAGAAVLALGACATLQLGRPGVSLHETYIEIHPGTNISMDDEQQLYRILGQYQSWFYKIKKTENGQVKTKGRLKDVFIEEQLLTEVMKAGGVSHFALQIGTPAHCDHTIHPDHGSHPEHVFHPEHTCHHVHIINPDHTIHPDHGSHPDSFTEKDYEKTLEMVRRITPILKKYSRD
jgi:hypothetical protein